MRKVALAIAAAIAFSASPAWATNGIRMIGFGPVQDAMGGVSVGAPLDAAAVLTNPAGMSQLTGRIDFGSALFGATVKANLEPLQPNDVTSDRPPSPIPAFGLIIPIDKQLTFGLGAYGIAGLGIDYAAGNGAGAGMIPGSATHTSYSQLRFAPGLSYKVSDEFSIGATLNLMYGALGLQFAGMSWPETASFGFGATVGASYALMKNFSIGVAYESPGWFQKYKFNASGVDLFGVSGHPAGTPLQGVDELAFDMPQTATVGAGYTMGNLLVALDLQWINWSSQFGAGKPKWTKSDTGFWVGFGNSLDVDWKDQYVAKVGLQYSAKPVTVRLGYNYGSEILSKTRGAQNLAFPAIATHHITAGLGFAFSDKFALNVSGMYSPEAKFTSTSQLPNPAAPGTFIPVTNTTKMTQWDGNIGISYLF